MSKEIINSKEHQKILDLFYSNEPANDLLIFEIIKHSTDENFSIMMLMSLMMNSKKVSFKEEMYEFINSNFQKKYRLGIRLLNLKKFGYFAMKPLLNIFEPAFSKIEILELFYRTIRRTGKGHDVFLIFDNGEHPRRREVFEAFMKLETGSKFNLPGLYPDEIVEFAELFFTKNKENQPFTISFNSLKSNEIPPILFSVNHDALHYRDDIIGEHAKTFPDFIFQFKDLTKLTLHLHPEVIVPNDWSALQALSILAFSKDGPVFQNIDFLDSMPSLKYLTNMMLRKPELFLQKKNIEMRMCDVPQKVRNKQRINLPDTVISQLGNDFKKSDLSLDRQEFYLTKFLTKKLSAFTEGEIEELAVVEFARTIKRFYNTNTKQGKFFQK